jgi:hypothetical protein
MIICTHFSFSFNLLALPEQSTAVGDLIQPVPGVLYEDSKSKKGDPRRYKVNYFDYYYFFIILYVMLIRMECPNMPVFMMTVVH